MPHGCLTLLEAHSCRPHWPGSYGSSSIFTPIPLASVDVNPSRLTKALVIVAFLWGFSEATWFFVIPDVYLTFVALLVWRRSGWCLLAVLSGTVCGACLVHGFPAWDWPSLWSALPGFRDGMMTTAEQQVREWGAPAINLGPANGIPYRYYIWVSANQDVSLIALLWATPLARLPRMTALMIFAFVAERVTQKWFSKEMHCVAWVLVWITVYIVYWGYFLPQTYP